MRGNTVRWEPVTVAQPQVQDLGPEEMLNELLQFHDRYEDLIEVLCSAANYGPEPKLEQSYLTIRAWMHDNYPTIQEQIAPFLLIDEDSDRATIEYNGAAPDAFYALFGPGDLREFLRADDGRMINRILRTREAIDLCAAHLRKKVG